MEVKQNIMVPLGYGKYARSDKIITLEPIEEDRGPGKRTVGRSREQRDGSHASTDTPVEA